MFDPDLLDEMFSPNEIEPIAGAFTTIWNSGLIEAQIKRERARLESGYAEEDDEALVLRIKAFRRKETALLELLKFCNSMKELLQ